MTKVPLYNKRGKHCGDYSLDGVYETMRDGMLNHIFLMPSRRGWVGLDEEVIIRLKELKCQTIHFLIYNWDWEIKTPQRTQPYKVVFSFSEFLNKAEEMNYMKERMGGKQRRISMYEGRRITQDQEQLSTP